MRKILKGCLGVVAALIAVHFALAEVNAGVFSECSPCEEALCGPCDPCNPCDAVCGKKSQWNFGGWLEGGLYVNQYGQRNLYATGAPVTHNLAIPGNTALLNNVQQSDFQMNQAWIYLEKTLDTRRGFDVGGRVDFVYGTDARLTQSAGLERLPRANNPNAREGWGQGDYYASFAQIYAEVGYKDVSVKAGKFVSPFGSESIMSPERFFYSLSYAFGQLPVTHTGVVATWAPSEMFSVVGGWVNGADQTFNDARDNAAVFGFTFTPTKKASLSYLAGIGQYDNSDWKVPDLNYFIHSLIVNVTLGKKWDYTFEWTLINNEWDRNYWGAYGINNELIYRFNKKWAAGFRAEWMHQYGGGGADFYGVTAGLNWTPSKWLLIRPEVRYDKCYGAGDPFNWYGIGRRGAPIWRQDDRNEQVSGGFSAVVQF